MIVNTFLRKLFLAEVFVTFKSTLPRKKKKKKTCHTENLVLFLDSVWDFFLLQARVLVFFSLNCLFYLLNKSGWVGKFNFDITHLS